MGKGLNIPVDINDDDDNLYTKKEKIHLSVGVLIFIVSAAWYFINLFLK